MAAFSCRRRGSLWFQMGCLIGLAVCLGCGSKAQQEAARQRADYVSGCQLMANGKLPEAIKAFDQAIAANPQDALAVFNRAIAYQRSGKTDLAITGYSEAIQLHHQITGPGYDASESRGISLGDELADAHFNRATLLSRAGRPDEAMKDFTETVRLDPKRADAYRSRGAAFLARHFPDLAIADLTEAMRLDPNSHEAVCRRAQAWLASGKYADARDDARSAIRLDPQCADAFHTLGSSLLLSPNQQPDRAIEYFSEAIRLNKKLATEITPELARAYFDRGVSLDKAGSRQEAQTAFDEAERLDPKYGKLRIEHNTEIALARNTSGTRTDSPIDLDPRLSELNQQALASLERKDLDTALGQYSNILRIYPTFAEAWYGRGIVFLEKDLPDSAVQDLNQAIRFAPDHAQAYGERGRAYLKMDDAGRAIQDTTEAIHLKPDLAIAHVYRATAHLRKSSFDLALADLDEAVKNDARMKDKQRSLFAEGYRGQGTKQMAARHWDEAIASFEKAISFEKDGQKRINPLLAQAYRERGLDHARRREFPEAVRDLNKAVELDKDNAQNHHYCGLACAMIARDCQDRGQTADAKEQWEDAVKHLSRALRLAPELRSLLDVPLEDAQKNAKALSKPVGVAADIGR